MSKTVACFALGVGRQAYPGRESLKERVSAGLGVLVTLAIRYINTPFLLAGCITYLVSTSTECVCTICKPQHDRSLRGFADRLWLVLPILCFAPYELPEELWYIAFPPPCDHNRCRLQRYMSPPKPWYHSLKELYQPIRRQYTEFTAPSQSQKPFPLLELPLELRNEIYSYVACASTIHTIRVVSQWRAGNGTQSSCNHKTSTTLLTEHGTQMLSGTSQQSSQKEDAVSYQLNDDGTLALHGAPPPTNLMLVNRQVYAEAQEIFWSTTAFEVQPLTPNDKSAWSVGGYEALATSRYAREMQKVRVRIDVARFSVGRQYLWPRIRGIAFEEIKLEECLQKLVPLTEELCRVLRASALRLRVVEIDWTDDFGDEVEGMSLQMRANVLESFTLLDKVKIRLRKLVVSGRGREEIMTMVGQVLLQSAVSR
jgi:hypothetical protein